VGGKRNQEWSLLGGKIFYRQWSLKGILGRIDRYLKPEFFPDVFALIQLKDHQGKNFQHFIKLNRTNE